MVIMASSAPLASNDLLHSIVLFACCAKFWIINNDRQLRRRSKCDDDRDDDRPPRPSAVSGNDAAVIPIGTPKNNDQSLKGCFSLDEEERVALMEKISHSDSVLTRETSIDFHSKNSNWSHFEKYEPSFAPPSNAVAENEDKSQEYFTWSEPPPSMNRVETNESMESNYSKYTRQQSTSNILHSHADCLPSRLIMIRHGQSEGNVDESLYATKPDNAMRLTELGWDMARAAGGALREQLPPGESVHFIVSPYARTVETFHGIASAWSDPEELAGVEENRGRRLKLWYTKLMEMGLTWHEDPRIREQDFGNYQDPEVIKKAKRERHKFGSFYYRFAHGESASDVFDRVSTFLDSLWRSFASGRAQNYVIVSHGISVRVFLTRYFRYSIDQFHMLANPKNCEMITLAHDGLGRLKLDGRCELELEERTEEDSPGGKDGVGTNNKRPKTTTTVVTGYNKHLRLRTLPPHHVHCRTVRMCYNDN